MGIKKYADKQLKKQPNKGRNDGIRLLLLVQQYNSTDLRYLNYAQQMFSYMRLPLEKEKRSYCSL